MDVQFTRVELSAIRDAVERHLEALPRPIDSFLEDHILESAHYRIAIDGASAGFASIHRANLITQFCLAEPYQRHGQSAFQRLRKMETVGAALVPTCDEFFLAHAIDDFRQLAKQAYFFTTSGGTAALEATRRFALRQAELGDAWFIRERSGEFFENLEQHLREQEIFLTLRDDQCVGFGIAVKSRFYRDVASIGMLTIEAFRNMGIGTATIALLIEGCRQRGVRPVAGCWYYNHLSKRTLERAGMVTRTRLLRIDY